MQVRKLALSLLPLFGLFLVSCGGHSTSVSQTPDYSTFYGNWRLVGQSSLPAPPFSAQSDYIGLAIDVIGNTIYARGDAFAVCAQGTSTIGSSISTSSPISTDGSFLLANSASPLSTLQYTIKGSAPPAGASTWQGSYTLSNSLTSTSCTFNQSGAFSATPYAPFHGTYAGTLSGTGFGSGRFDRASGGAGRADRRLSRPNKTCRTSISR